MGFHPLDVPKDRLAEFCRRRRIRKLSIFGSAVHDDFRPDSDVDILVQFEPGHVLGLAIMDLEAELSWILGGRKVDLVNEKHLNARLRDRILAEARVQYAEG